jgi:hypothetical protein
MLTSIAVQQLCFDDIYENWVCCVGLTYIVDAIVCSCYLFVGVERGSTESVS